MAQKVTVNHVSDLSGSTIKTDNPTVTFGLDGTNYEIDLTEAEQKRFRDAFAEYVAEARKVTGRKVNGKASKVATGPAAADVRAWAKDNGFKDLPERGRIPAEVREAYDAAN